MRRPRPTRGCRVSERKKKASTLQCIVILNTEGPEFCPRFINLSEIGVHCIGPVSYTHLDVYKRQLLIGVPIVPVI